MVLTSAANAEPSAPEPFGRKDISICFEKLLGVSKCSSGSLMDGGPEVARIDAE